MRGLAVGLLLVATLAEAAIAEETSDGKVSLTALQMKTWCESADDSEKLLCVYYLRGFADAINGYAAFEKTPVCLPEGQRVEQLRLVVLKYFAKYPEELHEPVGLPTGVALTLAFPCPNLGELLK